MSVLGTSVVAGVAQTSQQARDVAQRRDRLTRQTAQEADRSRQIIDGLVHTVEVDHDHAARLTIQDQPPEHHNPPNDQASQETDENEPQNLQSITETQQSQNLSSTSYAVNQANVSQSSDDKSLPPLYHHVDVQA